MLRSVLAWCAKKQGGSNRATSNVRITSAKIDCRRGGDDARRDRGRNQRNALSAARVFVNVKITAAVDPTNADALADDYCASKGYAYAASYKNRLIVASAGYMRFALAALPGHGR